MDKISEKNFLISSTKTRGIFSPVTRKNTPKISTPIKKNSKISTTIPSASIPLKPQNQALKKMSARLQAKAYQKKVSGLPSSHQRKKRGILLANSEVLIKTLPTKLHLSTLTLISMLKRCQTTLSRRLGNSTLNSQLISMPSSHHNKTVRRLSSLSSLSVFFLSSSSFGCLISTR